MSPSPRAAARPIAIALTALLAIALLPTSAVTAFSQSPATVWINELHYDNASTDVGEAVEIAGPAGTDLAGWSLVLYNGTGGMVYATTPLTGSIDDEAGSGFGALSFTPATIQNGAPDGLALVDDGGTVVQFLSYEGGFAAVGGFADGLVSTDIGVSQPGTGAAGQSLQLTGTGSTYQAFTWNAETTASFGSRNAGQTFAVVDAAPSLASSVPANGATGVAVDANVALTFSEPVDATDPWFDIVCAASGAHIAVVAGGPMTYTLDPTIDFTAGETCTVTIVATLIADVDTDDPPDTMAADAEVTFTVAQANPCEAAFTAIPTIQGVDDIADITGPVTTEGVVVSDDEGPAPALRGFYLQDPSGDASDATSDGIFVFNGNANSVTNGDVVRVTGTAAEFQGQTQISASEIVACGTGASVTPTDISFPVAIAGFLERYEGMLVRVPQPMTVTETFQLGRFGQVTLSAGGRLRNPTAVVEPGAPATQLQAENDRRKIILDDSSQMQNPDPIVWGRGGQPLSATNTLRGGDVATGIVGVMTYTWAGNAASGNAYRIRPLAALGGSATFTAGNPRPGLPLDVDGGVRVAALNLLNYFNTFGNACTQGVGGFSTGCRGAENATEFARQVPKTVAAILGLDADVIGVNEVENDGYGPTSAIAHLVDQLNAATAPGTYAFVDVDTETGQTNALGDDAIKVGLIYRPDAVTPVGATAALNSAAFVLGGDNPPAPPLPQLRSRPSLAQAFETPDGARFVLDVNHFKSKGSPCDTPDQLDGQGNCAVVRANAAIALAEWLATDPTGTGDPDVLIMGDLNSYAREHSITNLLAAGYTNLIDTLADPYSYVFDGQWGYLDHALGSASATAQVADVVEWHINADEPSVLDYNTNFKSPGQLISLYAPDRFRVSDHDPIIVGLDATSDRPTVDAGGPYTVEELGSVLLTAAGSDPTEDALTYAWDLDGSGTFKTSGATATFDAGTLQAPQTVTVSVRVTDEHGQSATDTATIDVIWDFGGFVAPIHPGITDVNAGSSLPVKFSLAGPQGLGILDGTPIVERWDCVTHAMIGEPVPATLGEPLRYDAATDRYAFVWKTPKAWAGSCATLTVTLDDGQAYPLDVRFGS